jgi:hypothetical protein
LLSLLFKVTIILLFSLLLLTLSNLSISSSGRYAEIYTPPQAYLPGNPLPEFAGKDACDKFVPTNMICGELEGRKLYWYYELATRRIVRTGISASEYTVGDLILAWGTPSGFDQFGTSIYVSWGTRSALLVTRSLQPNSQIQFIEYDLDPPKRSVWRGFRSHPFDHFVLRNRRDRFLDTP